MGNRQRTNARCSSNASHPPFFHTNATSRGKLATSTLCTCTPLSTLTKKMSNSLFPMPDETVGVHAESISDDGMMGIENGGSSSSCSSSTPGLSVATDMACSGVGVGVGTGGDTVPLAVLPPPSIEEQVSLVRVLLENSNEIQPGQTRFLVAKR